ADRLARPQRAAMRLLPERPAHAGRVAAEGHAEPDRQRYRRRDERQSLPLRHLYADPRRDQAGGDDHGRCAMTPRRMPGEAIANISRRGLLSGIAAGSLILAIGLPAQAEEEKFAGEGMANGLREDPKIFIAIAEDGTVSVISHRSEMGQGIRTSIPMVVADELEADWAKVKVVQAPGDEAKFGNQDTDGSRSMRHHFAV